MEKKMEQKNNWGIYTIRKVIEYCGIALALWQFGIPAINNHIESRIEQYKVENHKIPLRKLLSEETGIKEDRFHVVFGEWWKSHQEVEELLNEVYPLLEEELTCITPRIVIHPNGEIKWYHTNGRIYDASLGQDGNYWFYFKGAWLACHT